MPRSGPVSLSSGAGSVASLAALAFSSACLTRSVWPGEFSVSPPGGSVVIGCSAIVSRRSAGLRSRLGLRGRLGLARGLLRPAESVLVSNFGHVAALLHLGAHRADRGRADAHLPCRLGSLVLRVQLDMVGDRLTLLLGSQVAAMDIEAHHHAVRVDVGLPGRLHLAVPDGEFLNRLDGADRVEGRLLFGASFGFSMPSSGSAASRLRPSSR